MNDQLRIVKYLVSALAVFVLVSGCGDTRLVRVKPVAVVSANNAGSLNTNVTLNGTGSYDPYDEALTYAWTLADIPLGSSAALGDAEAAVTSFLADKSGYYTVTLQVTNTSGSASDFATTVLHVTGDGTLNPVAVIEVNVPATINNSVVLDGSSSSDPLDETLTHAWTLVEMPNRSVAELVSSTGAFTSFLADKGGYYTVTLIVTNASGETSKMVSVRVFIGG